MKKRPDTVGRAKVGPVLSRRRFLTVGAAGAAACALPLGVAEASSRVEPSPVWRATLMDITACIGCRKCEAACAVANGLPPVEPPVDDTSVFEIRRRPTDRMLTVINRYPTDDPERPLYVKDNCMHCVDPACASACIVGALVKDPVSGAVGYDAAKCIGCRYCMVACPYQIPAYEYDAALTPRVMKCGQCSDRLQDGETAPACVKACPREALLFGRRDEILALARERIRQNPGRYVDKIYGETEAGGAGMFYLSPVPFDRLGFLPLPDSAPPRLTEAIQHGVFKYFIPPVALFGLLGTAMHVLRDPGDRDRDR